MHSLLYIQLNIIGRYLFIKWQEDEAGVPPSSLEPPKSGAPAVVLSRQVQQKFLSSIAFFQTEGISVLMEKVESAVSARLSKISLKQVMTAEDIAQVVQAVRDDLEDDREPASKDPSSPAEKKPSSFSVPKMLLPMESDEDPLALDPALRMLNDEIRDILERFGQEMPSLSLSLFFFFFVITESLLPFIRFQQRIQRRFQADLYGSFPSYQFAHLVLFR